MSRLYYSCPASCDDAVEVTITGPWHSPEPEVTDISCGHELTPAEIAEYEQRALDEVTEGAEA